MDWVTEEVLDDVFEKGYYDLREQHQVAITEKDRQHSLAIENKDTTIALLTDDLALLEQDNMELQHHNEILRRRYVPYLENSDKEWYEYNTEKPR